MAYLIQKNCENVEHVIYEKNGDIGGTWLEVVSLEWISAWVCGSLLMLSVRTDIPGVLAMSLLMHIRIH